MKSNIWYISIMKVFAFIIVSYPWGTNNLMAQATDFTINQHESLTEDLATIHQSIQQPIFSLIMGSNKGSIMLNTNGTFTFSPFSSSCGSTGFTYQVCDAANLDECFTATVTIQINPDLNQLQVIQLNTSCNTEITGNIFDYRALPDGSVFNLVSSPASGILNLQTDGNFSFTPIEGDCQPISFEFQVCWPEDNLCCQDGTVEINFPEEEDCHFYVSLIENNCCSSCPKGNFIVKTAYWESSYEFIVSQNIALLKPSIFNGTPNHKQSNAHKSNDGKFEGESNSNFDYSFSKYGIDNRWDIDLIGQYDIESIRIFTMESCCIGTTTEYDIFIADTPFTSNDLSTNQNETSIFHTKIPISTTTPAILNNLSVVGRFVRIYLAGEGQMQLVEVEIIGSGRPDSAPYEYVWDDPTIGNNSTPFCLDAGHYNIEIKDTTKGCSVKKEIVVD